MKARIPYTFMRPVHSGKDRNGELPALWISGFEVDIPEMDGRDAPVVASWTTNFVNHFQRADRKTVRCRHRDGRFYVLASENGDFETVAGRFADVAERDWRDAAHFVQMATVLCGGASPIGGLSPDQSDSKRCVAVSFELGSPGGEERVVEIFSRKTASRHPETMIDTQVADLAAARRQAEGLVVIDGVLWRAVCEPKISMKVVALLGAAVLSVEFGDGVTLDLSGDRPRPRRRLFFPLDAMDAASHAVRLLDLRLREDTSLVTTAIREPGLFSFDAGKNLACRILAMGVELHGWAVGGMDVGQIEAFVALREAVGRLGSHSDDAEIGVALGTVFAGFLDLMPDGPRKEELHHGLSLLHATSGGRFSGYTPDTGPHKVKP